MKQHMEPATLMAEQDTGKDTTALWLKRYAKLMNSCHATLSKDGYDDLENYTRSIERTADARWIL